MIVPPVSLIQLLPISLAGWGVREVVLVIALASFGVPAEAALATSVLLGLCLIIIGVPGGLLWLTDWDIARPDQNVSVGKNPSWVKKKRDQNFAAPLACVAGGVFYLR